jgi:ankyrin repeat protein
MLSLALMHACEAGRHACIPTLLRHLANPNTLYGATEQSALMLAAEKGYVDVVRCAKHI